MARSGEAYVARVFNRECGQGVGVHVDGFLQLQLCRDSVRPGRAADSALDRRVKSVDTVMIGGGEVLGSDLLDAGDDHLAENLVTRAEGLKSDLLLLG